MIVEKVSLWGEEKQAYYVKYLLEKSEEYWKDKRRPAMIVCPGGGYLMTSDREGEPVAMHYLNQGYQAFVLRYTSKDKGDSTYPNCLYDLAQMISLVRENAEEWNIDPDKIGIIGFSAGGHLCASLAAHWQDDFLREKLGKPSEQYRPNAVILGYPVLDFITQQEETKNDPTAEIVDPQWGHSKASFMKIADQALAGNDLSPERFYEVSPINHITEKVPPIFIWHTATDGLVYVTQSMKFAIALKHHNVPFELHIFEEGDHGLSLANEVTASHPGHIMNDVALWTEQADRFIKRHAW